MTYGEFAKVLRRWLKLISKEPMTLEFRRVMKAIDGEDSPTVEDVLRFLGRAQPLPPLPPQLRFEVAIRLEFGIWTCKRDPEEVLFEDASGGVESVLIEYWRDVGRTDWLYDILIRKHAPDQCDPPRGAPPDYEFGSS